MEMADTDQRKHVAGSVSQHPDKAEAVDDILNSMSSTAAFLEPKKGLTGRKKSPEVADADA